jgi:hypothetical protein
MAALKKNKKTGKKKKRYPQADLMPALYDNLSVKETLVAYSPLKKTSGPSAGVLPSARTKNTKQMSKITKTPVGHQAIQIPSPDYVDRFIADQKMEIDSIRIDKKQGFLFFVLTNGLVIQEKISKYPLLKRATEPQLKKYHLYAGGTCVEWVDLDEDLSLRGLLKQAIFEPLLKTLRGLDGFVLTTD